MSPQYGGFLFVFDEAKRTMALEERAAVGSFTEVISGPDWQPKGLNCACYLSFYDRQLNYARADGRVRGAKPATLHHPVSAASHELRRRVGARESGGPHHATLQSLLSPTHSLKSERRQGGRAGRVDPFRRLPKPNSSGSFTQKKRCTPKDRLMTLVFISKSRRKVSAFWFT